MSELRVTWRMATWYQCLPMIVVAAFVGWVIRDGLRSTSGRVWSHVLIPVYGIWLYVTLAALVNRRSVVAAREGLRVANGPIPLGGGRKWIPREDIAFVWYAPVVAINASNDTSVLWHDTGIQTTAGRNVPLFVPIDGGDAARAAVQGVVTALGSAQDWSMVPVRILTNPDPDTTETRRIAVWVAIVGAAIIAGIVWESVLPSFSSHPATMSEASAAASVSDVRCRM